MPAVIRGGRSQARTDRRTPVAAAGRCAESVGVGRPRPGRGPCRASAPCRPRKPWNG